MPGQAIVSINENQWNVLLATTYAELTTGLREVASINPGTGMLFILSSSQAISVDTTGMNFPIDIIFIANNLVVDVASNVDPGYLVTEEIPCDSFLEVNANETFLVEVGDSVNVEVAPAEGFDFSSIMSFAMPLVVLGFVSGMVGGMAKLMGGSSHSSETRRLGEPKTEAERRKTHLAKYGTEELPERGEGLKKLYSLKQLSQSSAGSQWEKETRFIGACKVVDGLCRTHGYSVSKTVRCPKSLLTDEEWTAAWELAEAAYPKGMSNPWVNGWWPETLEEAEGAAKEYEWKMGEAVHRFKAKQVAAIENYERAADKASYNYRRYVVGEYEKGKELSVVASPSAEVLKIHQETGYIPSSEAGEYITITDPGKTTFVPGEVVSKEAFDKENERVRRLGEREAKGVSSKEHHSMWLTPEQRKELEKKTGTVAVRWAEEATKPGDMKGVEVAAEYYYGKLKEVFGLGHLSPELSEEQIKKLREVLGLPKEVPPREKGYID